MFAHCFTQMSFYVFIYKVVEEKKNNILLVECNTILFPWQNISS